MCTSVVTRCWRKRPTPKWSVRCALCVAQDGVEDSRRSEAALDWQRVDRFTLRRQRVSVTSQRTRHRRQCHRPLGVLGSSCRVSWGTHFTVWMFLVYFSCCDLAGFIPRECSICGFFGVLGVPRVFWARRQQVVATLFIVVLAAVDFSTCLVLMPFTIYMELVRFHVNQDAICKLYQVWFLIWLHLYKNSLYRT